MGFATSITVAILFLSFLVIGSIAYPVMFKSYENVQDSINEKHKLQMSQLNTKITIISTAANVSKIDITVSNNGSTVLHANKSNILINGSFSTYTVNPSGLWLPTKNAVFTVSADPASTHDIKIITENGISDLKTHTGV